MAQSAGCMYLTSEICTTFILPVESTTSGGVLPEKDTIL